MCVLQEKVYQDKYYELIHLYALNLDKLGTDSNSALLNPKHHEMIHLAGNNTVH